MTEPDAIRGGMIMLGSTQVLGTALKVEILQRSDGHIEYSGEHHRIDMPKGQSAGTNGPLFTLSAS